MKRAVLSGVLVVLVIMTGLMIMTPSHMEELPAIQTGGMSGPIMRKVDGNIGFYVRVDFDMNRFFSRYDVKMLLDGEEIATIYHGRSYEGMFGVSEGFHTLTFANAKNPSVQSCSLLKITRDASYSCAIHANRRKVTIRDEKLDGVAVDHESLELEQFIGACKPLDYETVNRFPERMQGEKTRITGKVTRAVDLPLIDISLMILADGNNIWFVSYGRGTQAGRILPGDVITIYGECIGLSSCFTGSGLLFDNWMTAVPAVASRYIVRNH